MKVTALAVIAVAARHASFACFIATAHASAASGQDATSDDCWRLSDRARGISQMRPG